jgi:hypothetical protein
VQNWCKNLLTQGVVFVIVPAHPLITLIEISEPPATLYIRVLPNQAEVSVGLSASGTPLTL